jgi:hypothetical protein
MQHLAADLSRVGLLLLLLVKLAVLPALMIGPLDVCRRLCSIWHLTCRLLVLCFEQVMLLLLSKLMPLPALMIGPAWCLSKDTQYFS